MWRRTQNNQRSREGSSERAENRWFRTLWSRLGPSSEQLTWTSCVFVCGEHRHILQSTPSKIPNRATTYRTLTPHAPPPIPKASYLHFDCRHLNLSSDISSQNLREEVSVWFRSFPWFNLQVLGSRGWCYFITRSFTSVSYPGVTTLQFKSSPLKLPNWNLFFWSLAASSLKVSIAHCCPCVHCQFHSPLPPHTSSSVV